VVVALAGCGPTVGPDDPPIDGRPLDAKNETCRRMDLLFVIDDSSSMQEEQDDLAVEFPMFADILNHHLVDGELIDYRAAITTVGVTATYSFLPEPPPGFPNLYGQTGDDGKLHQTCGMPRPWLERTDPAMVETFSCAALVGTDGPSIEMPLRAAELALLDATNPGFVRDDALLGIIIITDGDDCSRRASHFETFGGRCGGGDPDMPDEQSFIDGFDARKGDRGRWAAAVIAGATDCMSDLGRAERATRLQRFVDGAGANAVFADLCGGDLAPALVEALNTFRAACDTFTPVGRQP
jgi:hypothetical protein